MELISVMRTFNRLEPVEINPTAGERALYDSLVFANVARMAKYGRVSNSGRPDEQPRISYCEFVATKASPIQIDGEVMQVDANSQVIIDCEFRALTTVG